jgi:transporter family-2 protein
MSIIHLTSKNPHISPIQVLFRPPSPFLLIALFCGGLLPIQVAMNSQLSRSIGSFPLAGDISYLVGSTILITLLLSGKFGQPNWTALAQAPWWSFCGGLMGAWYVSSSAYFTSSLGTTLTIGFIVSGQSLMGMLVDNFGWLGVKKRRLTNNRRLAGALLVLAIFFLTLR